MDQINLSFSIVESEEVSTGACQTLSELELALIGGGIGDTIL